jgi:integrase
MTNEQQQIIRIRIGDYVTVYPRGKKGIYTAEFCKDGKHHRQSLKTRNLKFAKERARKLDLLLAEGIYPAHRQKQLKVNLVQAIDDFIKYQKTEGRRRKTVVKQEGVLLRKFAPFANEKGILSVDYVTQTVVDQYRDTQCSKLAPKSMHNEGVILKNFLGWCLDRKYIAENPLATRKFRRPKLDPVGGPTMEQINLILTKAPVVRLVPFAILAFTGMRAGECQQLRPEDVDLTGGWIHIVSREGAETKTGQSRKVPIHTQLHGILASVPKGKRDWYLTALPSPKFPQGGHHLNMKHVCEDFKKVLQKLGIPIGKKARGYTLHSLRSSFKTICIHAGIPREVVDEWQGHASRRPAASDAYYKLSDSESQRFMLTAPFGAT